MIINIVFLMEQDIFLQNGLQNYLVFVPNILHIEYISNNNGFELFKLKEVLKIHILQILHFLQSWLTGLLNLVEWNLKEYV